MLQVIRERVQGLFSYLIIGAIILSFSLWGVNEWIGTEDTGFQVAIVNGTDLSTYEYQIAYQNERNRMQQMFGNNFDPDLFDDQIKSSALERVVENEIILQDAINSGLSISDKQLANRIHLIDAFQEEGRFSKAAYERSLVTSGQSKGSFEARIRRALLADQIINGIAATAFTTNQDVELIYQLQNQEREFAYLMIPPESFKKDLKIPDEDIQKHYDANPTLYQSQEQVNLEYVELTADLLKEEVSVSEEELENFYEENKDRYVVEEQRKARHILVTGDDAETKASDILEKIRAGGDFAELAKEYSEDPGSAEEGGLLEFFGRDIMDKAFEEAAFSLGIGEVSELVESDFGFHIIKVEEINPQTGKSFSEVRNEIDEEVRRSKSERIYIDKVEALANMAYEIPDSLLAINEELGLEIKTSGFISRAGGPGIASERKIIDAAFSVDVLQERLNSEAIELGSNHAVIVRVKEYLPAARKPFSEVKAQITNELINQKVKELVVAEGKKLLAQVRNGGDAKLLAEQASYEWKDKALYTRNSAEVDRDILNFVFAMNKPGENETTVEGMPLTSGGYAIAVLSAVKNGDPATLTEEERTAQLQGIANTIGLDEFSTLLKILKDEAEIQRFPGNL